MRLFLLAFDLFRPRFVVGSLVILSLYPGKITSSAGGHVDEGENYKTAALRELKEELGISTPLRDLGRFDVDLFLKIYLKAKKVILLLTLAILYYFLLAIF